LIHLLPSLLLLCFATCEGKVGLGICYDLRFAEFAISLAKAGASILTYPSSFTVKTGLAHWEALLKARAIETQCYVVAAAQTGIHNPKRSSYGHAMVVDPWGHIIAQCSDKVGFAVAQVDQKYLVDVRKRLPVWTDRKPNAYGDIWPADIVTTFDTQSEHSFGKSKVSEGQVFLRTAHSFAFVNHRPILKGHVLVATQRSVEKFTELSPVEVADLFQTVQRVQKAIEQEHEANAATIALQDGRDAGQSVEHVHVHVLPRKQSDFGGKVDEVYTELSQHDKRDSAVRTQSEMAEEADRLRTYFST
jgi:diadenosine tetraphosphate (Ap4A) HIT family hydrolase